MVLVESGARAITQDLMVRLRRHYIKPGKGPVGGVFLPEVGWNGSWGASSRCDAIYVGFTSTSGRVLVGHEVKATRGDWLRELDRPGKADPWADECHEWWIVAAPGVVKVEELPDGWGLMLPGTSRTRMKIVTVARRHGQRTPSWDAARALLARMDTLEHDKIAEGVRAGRAALAAQYADRVQEAVASDRLRRGDDADGRAELARIRAALGVAAVLQADDVEYGTRVTETTLAQMAELLRVHRTVQDATQALVRDYAWTALAQMREAIATLESLRAAATPLPVVGRTLEEVRRG